jgi:hypothetical protein
VDNSPHGLLRMDEPPAKQINGSLLSKTGSASAFQIKRTLTPALMPAVEENEPDHLG